jgi:hypothetical protein
MLYPLQSSVHQWALQKQKAALQAAEERLPSYLNERQQFGYNVTYTS